MLSKSSTENEYHIYCITDDSYDWSNFITNIKSNVKSTNWEINKISSKLAFADGLHDSKIKKISAATYIRLEIPELLPNVDKVAYFDCDVYFNCDVAEYFSLELGNAYFSAVIDTQSLQFLDGKRELGDKTYFSKFKDSEYKCAGVMLINNLALRKENMLAKFIEFSKSNFLPKHDQTILNCVCRGRTIQNPLGYGLFNHSSNFKEYLKHAEDVFGVDKKTLISTIKNYKILHMINKPWNRKKISLTKRYISDKYYKEWNKIYNSITS